MLYVGDTHLACRAKYVNLAKAHSPRPSIQVGDLAIGFPSSPELPIIPNARFIRGNHDSPDEARRHPNYLGDFGYWEEEGIFFISGARSIDWDNRIDGISRWAGEELNIIQWEQALRLYKVVRPKKVVSHDCPISVSQTFWKGKDFSGGTSYGLQTLLDAHQPDLWVFGHWHKTKQGGIKSAKTHFVCLGCEFDEKGNQVGVDVVED